MTEKERVLASVSSHQSVGTDGSGTRQLMLSVSWEVVNDSTDQFGNTRVETCIFVWRICVFVFVCEDFVQV